MAKPVFTAEQISQIKAECVKAFDARDAMAEKMFWDIKYATVHECWGHCHGGVENPARESAAALQREIIAQAQGRINEIADGEDWYSHPELGAWWDAENDKREAALAKLFLDMEY